LAFFSFARLQTPLIYLEILMLKTSLALLPALLLLACAEPATQSAAPSTEKVSEAAAVMDMAAPAVMTTTDLIQSAMAGSHRSAENKARDQYRHPMETLSFFGLQSNMRVVEISPGGGWFTEILAPVLAKSGSYVAVMNDPAKASSDRAKAYYTQQNMELEAKFKANPELYGTPSVIGIDMKAPVLGEAGSADMVVTFRNVHNWVGQGAEKAMFKAFFDVLKPGGVLGLKEHRAAAGTDAAISAKSGYMSEESVIAIATSAGFVLKAKSEINANPKDTRDHKEGVWTLPPSLALGEVDKAKYLAIGESDRMTLLFVKPAM
jgi:predicted methyltransferase